MTRKTTPLPTYRVAYKTDEPTYLQRQMAAFNAGSTLTPSTRTETAEWAEKFDPLNGKTAGKREALRPFGKEE